MHTKADAIISDAELCKAVRADLDNLELDLILRCLENENKLKIFHLNDGTRVSF